MDLGRGDLRLFATFSEFKPDTEKYIIIILRIYLEIKTFRKCVTRTRYVEAGKVQQSQVSNVANDYCKVPLFQTVIV